MTHKTSVYDALFDELDDDTKKRFGLDDPDGAKAAEKQAQLDEDRDADLPEPPTTKQAVGRMGFRDVITVGKGVVRAIGEDRVTSVSAGVTFFALLSLFPAITAFVSLYGLLADPLTIESHMKMLEPLMPEGSLDIIRDQVLKIASAPGSALSIAGLMALGIAFYSATGGVKALLSALNVALYQKETRGFIRLNVVASAFMLGGLVMVISMLGVIAVVPAVVRMVPMGVGVEWAVTLIRWPIMFGVLLLALAALYRWGPAAPDSRWRWISPGAIFAGIALVITSGLFSWYAANFGNYNETYGSLGAVVALMTWLWLNSTIILVGAEINSELERHIKDKAGIPVPDPGEGPMKTPA
ncbi:YihY/virulence factor BrkB family protein [Paracoccus sp. (in: a-proteobacteria)]|uniref:YihY/virulence factor BrkB family protein n=1 Tax=Paracoccus sp. TaxID=267 RepID=UPI0026DF2199|nr:YihY/virulence factor BrkB family protein [Paracoccus sp. (in: a-proteobacteria)]MDO5646573.1 YihY/virulence factor BrkB family protein [Paracoccus sp. (in: a-proteobacteria)]